MFLGLEDDSVYSEGNSHSASSEYEMPQSEQHSSEYITPNISDSQRLLNTLKGKVVRIFYKDIDEAFYDYILDVYNIGNHLLLKVADCACKCDDKPVEEFENEYFEIISWDNIEEIHFFRSDQD